MFVVEFSRCLEQAPISIAAIVGGGRPLDFWLNLILQVGLPSALVLWFVWQTGTRETALRTEMAELQRFHRETMAEALKESTEAIAGVTAILNRIDRRMEAEYHGASPPPARRPRPAQPDPDRA